MERPQRGDAQEVKEVDDLLAKSERSFAAAELLLGAGDADFAASRAYYGYFYVAQRLLIHRGIRPSSHAGVVGQYGLHFAEPEVPERRFGRMLDRAFALRQLADYGAAPYAPRRRPRVDRRGPSLPWRGAGTPGPCGRRRCRGQTRLSANTLAFVEAPEGGPRSPLFTISEGSDLGMKGPNTTGATPAAK